MSSESYDIDREDVSFMQDIIHKLLELRNARDEIRKLKAEIEQMKEKIDLYEVVGKYKD